MQLIKCFNSIILLSYYIYKTHSNIHPQAYTHAYIHDIDQSKNKNEIKFVKTMTKTNTKCQNVKRDKIVIK